MKTVTSEPNPGGLYLDKAQILPGDVLLTTSTGLSSTAIRTFTKSDFSHAALILLNSAILEARGDGVGHTLLRCNRAELPNQLHGARLLSRLPEGTSAAILLRSPGLAQVLTEKQIDLVAFTRPFLWQHYAALPALAETLYQQPVVMTFARHVLKIIDKGRHERIAPGLFCSELVAAIFADLLGEPLISGLDPQHFSPNTFLSLGWNQVRAAITEADPSAEESPIDAAVVNLPLNLAFDRERLPDLVSFAELTRRLKRDAEQRKDER